MNAAWRTRLIAFAIAAGTASLVWVLTPAWLVGVSRIVAAYDGAAAALVIAFWALGISGDPERTEQRAVEEDPGRNLVLGVVLLTVVAGLVSAVAILGRGPNIATGPEKAVAYSLAIGAVAIGWVLIHTMFTFRYAHLYYYDDDEDNEADRGLTFPGTKNPSDLDFAYFSFVIGMTYQVSDVQITDSRVRRFVLYHALISFAYSTMIVALAINIVSGLLH